MVFIYTILSLVGLLGFCSLAIDFGRYEMCKTQLRRAAIAAARAGCANMTSSSAATTAAQNMAYANYIDTENISNSNCTITVAFLNWPSTTALSSNNFSQANAVRVTIRYTVPLLFAQILGLSGKDTSQTSVAALATQTVSPYVSAFSNPWLSGEYVASPGGTPPLAPSAKAAGTTGSQPDPAYNGPDVDKEHPWKYDLAGPNGGTAASGEGYESPVQVNFTVIPGATITISSVSGTAGNDWTAGAVATADGNQSGTYYNYDDAASNGTAEHGMSDATMPLNSINGVFLNNYAPDDTNNPDAEPNKAPPPALDFSTQTERDYTNIAPQLQQVFFIGNGETSGSNTQQTITVPTNATRFFLGTMDGWEWSNNIGGYNVTVTETTITIVQ